ncbi:Uncharacterised protein [BD1-7 clade bacterium]|uniref:SRPBCC family protein n=1 Tax=BD1-7 clade bacterium TaxID=2029982 RepID=A0A5S9QWF2_9GAMM|nr:Uncharacterised protein [BD1-7 clade bacterium]
MLAITQRLLLLIGIKMGVEMTAGETADIPITETLPEGLVRVESVDQAAFNAICEARTPRMHPHHELYGRYCSLEAFVECSPEALFNYLAQPESLLEWTYSLRNMKAMGDGLLMFGDKVGGPTQCYCRVDSNAEAMTVDYHCAWDQSETLWMIYYMRVMDATRWGRSGALVTWTNCCHPFYLDNPWPELVPEQRSIWVGDGWPFFKAGHQMELDNLKAIAEHRHANGIDLADLSHLVST